MDIYLFISDIVLTNVSCFQGGIQTIFAAEDMEIYREAEQIAHEAKSSRQFTDLNKFTLKCMVCDKLLTGQAEAQKHAKETKHTNFGEV